MDSPVMLTPEDVAGALRIEVTTVRKMARDGKIPSIKLGKHWRFPVLKLLEWIDEIESQSTPVAIPCPSTAEKIHHAIGYGTNPRLQSRAGKR